MYEFTIPVARHQNAYAHKSASHQPRLQAAMLAMALTVRGDSGWQRTWNDSINSLPRVPSFVSSGKKVVSVLIRLVHSLITIVTSAREIWIGDTDVHGSLARNEKRSDTALDFSLDCRVGNVNNPKLIVIGLVVAFRSSHQKKSQILQGKDGCCTASMASNSVVENWSPSHNLTRDTHSSSGIPRFA